MEIKEFINSLTRAELEKVANKDFTFLNGETLVALREAGLTQKQLATYAKEALKHIPNNEATIKEDIDPDNYFMPDPDQEPKQNTIQEEINEQELYKEIEQAIQPQAKKKPKTALERIQMLDSLKNWGEKFGKSEIMLKRIDDMIEMFNNDEATVHLDIIMISKTHAGKKETLTISKNNAVALCLEYVREETQKQKDTIATEIEALEF